VREKEELRYGDGESMALLFLWSPPTERRCRNGSTGTVSASYDIFTVVSAYLSVYSLLMNGKYLMARNFADDNVDTMIYLFIYLFCGETSPFFCLFVFLKSQATCSREHFLDNFYIKKTLHLNEQSYENFEIFGGFGNFFRFLLFRIAIFSY
jgi:hypothetical protein